jgi:5'-nucleotidase / UDP-sugar diphosphatase
MMKKKLFLKPAYTLIFLLSFILNEGLLANDKFIQILHTNDLHAFMDHSDYSQDIGGLARVKTLVDQLKNEARSEKTPTLFFDAGDFSEGNSYYLARNARSTFKIMNLMGYDAVTMGNHDFLMGGPELNSILKEVPPTYKFLTANVTISKKYPQVRNYLDPYVIYKIQGKKIAVVGLTTNSLAYAWRFTAGKLESPYRPGDIFAKHLKRRKGVDYVIALTHLGIGADIKLAKKSKYIDLIIGGHSHNSLFRTVYQKNKKGRRIPIVQAGSHGNYLGQIKLKVEKKSLKLAKYRLHRVENIKKDPVIDKFVQGMYQNLKKEYGKNWDTKVYGHSFLTSKKKWSSMNSWGVYIAKSVQKSARADIGLHVTQFAGTNFPRGPITMRKIMDGYPRQFDVEDRQGWSVYNVKVSASLLMVLLQEFIRSRLPVYMSGVEIKKLDKLGRILPPFIKINGKVISPHKFYTIAMPEGIVKGAKGISKTIAKILMPKTVKTNKKVWQSIKDQLSVDPIIKIPGDTRIQVIEDKNYSMFNTENAR